MSRNNKLYLEEHTLDDILQEFYKILHRLDYCELEDNAEPIILDLFALNKSIKLLTGVNLLDEVMKEKDNRIKQILIKNTYKLQEKMNNSLVNKLNQALICKQKMDESNFLNGINSLLEEFESEDTPLPNYDLSDEDQEKIVNIIFESLGEEFINTYNDLASENRIFFLSEEEYKAIAYRTGTVEYSNNNLGTYVVIGKGNNFIEKMLNLVHEITHIMDEKKILKENNLEGLNAFNNSLYKEANPLYKELYCLKVLQTNGVDSDFIKTIKTNKMKQFNRHLNYFNQDIRIDYTIKYVLGGIMAFYFDDINDENELRQVIEMFDQEKMNNQGTEIFNSIGCPQKVLVKSVEKYIRRQIAISKR